MTMANPNSELADSDDFLIGIVSGLVKISFYHMNVVCQGSQVVVRLLQGKKLKENSTGKPRFTERPVLGFRLL